MSKQPAYTLRSYRVGNTTFTVKVPESAPSDDTASKIAAEHEAIRKAHYRAHMEEMIGYNDHDTLG